MLSAIVDGVCYSFAIYLSAWLDHFGEAKSKTALIGSVLTGTYLIIGELFVTTTKIGLAADWQLQAADRLSDR